MNDILTNIQNGLLERKYNTSLNDEFETLVTNELNTAADEIGKLTRDNLNVVNNRFVNMENAGSKGNPINICQMIACVGQCAVDGKRFRNIIRIEHYLILVSLIIILRVEVLWRIVFIRD